MISYVFANTHHRTESTRSLCLAELNDSVMLCCCDSMFFPPLSIYIPFTTFGFMIAGIPYVEKLYYLRLLLQYTESVPCLSSRVKMFVNDKTQHVSPVSIATFTVSFSG